MNERLFKFGITEAILSDDGKQYQSKLLELVYDHLDMRKIFEMTQKIKQLKTTPKVMIKVKGSLECLIRKECC